jgi:hypothetical protein
MQLGRGLARHRARMDHSGDGALFGNERAAVKQLPNCRRLSVSWCFHGVNVA